MNVLARVFTVAVVLVMACAGCAAKAGYQLAWTIDAVRPGGARRQFATGTTPEFPDEWGNAGSDVRILDAAPREPHDTIAIVYWHHYETPLVTKARDTDCRTVTRPGSVTTQRVCASREYVVEAQCDAGCRRQIVRAVADSLGAAALIVAEEQLEYRGQEGEPAIGPQTYAQNDGFRGTYVLITSPDRDPGAS